MYAPSAPREASKRGVSTYATGGGSWRGRCLALCLVSSPGSSRGKYVSRFVVAFQNRGLVAEETNPHVCNFAIISSSSCALKAALRNDDGMRSAFVLG